MERKNETIYVRPIYRYWSAMCLFPRSNGLRKASKSLSRMIQSHGKGTAFYTALAEFFVRLTFSVMLLFYPTEKFEAHIVLLRLELIAVSIRLTKRISPALDDEE